MESCLGELHLNWCIIYLDDIIVFSKTLEEHLERLRGVFDKLAKAGLKLKPSKCEFFKSKITYLGHIVLAAGIETDPKKIEAVKNWTTPMTVTDIWSSLAFTNHYQRFIKGYAKVANPLNALVSGDNANKKKAAVNWTDDCQRAFKKLKDLCTDTSILACTNYKRPFQLQTDASDLGLGAVLYQKDDEGQQRVIAYASWSLSHTERNYPVTDRFHEYLYRGQFDVYTDNDPLIYILTSTKLDMTGQRWVASLANYNFRIFYKAGKTNIEADALSHIPRPEYQVMDTATVKAIIDVVPRMDLTEYNYNPTDVVCKAMQMVVHKKSRDDWKT